MINTCCVTNEALAKSRKAAARAARTHARVYVTGCGANLAGEAFGGLPANVTVVARRSEETAAFVAGDVGAIGCVQADARLDRVRAFVKIQDGCSFSCNFCVIPLVRGASRSRSAEAVLGEIERRVAQGHREVVLTGINLGCFRDRGGGLRPAGARPRCGPDARARTPAAQLHRDQPRLRRARRRASRDAVVSRHLHVPLQSGDDGVLRAMGRRYTTSTYLRRLEPLAGEFNLTADVIVGFPAEDERGLREHAANGGARGHHKGARVPVLAAARHRHRGGRPCSSRGEEGARRAAACTLGRAVPAALGGEGRGRATSCSSTGRDAATATTTRRGSSTLRSASSCTCGPRR